MSRYYFNPSVYAPQGYHTKGRENSVKGKERSLIPVLKTLPPGSSAKMCPWSTKSKNIKKGYSSTRVVKANSNRSSIDFGHAIGSALVDITVALQLPADLSECATIKVSDAGYIETNYDNQSRKFNFDGILDEGNSDQASKQIEQLGLFDLSNDSSVTILISDAMHKLVSDTHIVKELLTKMPIEYYEIYMSYYFVDCKLNTTNDLFATKENEDGFLITDYSMLARRRIHSVQHAFDLIQLGNLKHKHQKITMVENNLVYVLKFELLFNANNQIIEHFVVDLFVGGDFDKDEKLIMLENLICNRQRNKHILEWNVLLEPLRPCLNLPDARLNILSQLSINRLNDKQILHHLEMLERIKQYGTEEDIYGDIIISKNRSILEKIRSTSDENDKVKLNISLMNNVSVLEAEMLDLYKRFLTQVEQWTEVHQEIYKSLTSREANCCQERLASLLKLFNDGANVHQEMAERVYKYTLGLDQLKLCKQASPKN